MVKDDDIYRKFKTCAKTIDTPFRRISRRKPYREMVNAEPQTEGEKHNWELHQ